MTDRIFGLLGLMRRASSVEPGEDRASEAVRNGKARLLLLPSDVPEAAAARADRYLEGRRALKVTLPCTGEEVGKAIGLNRCSMLAVTDLGFAKALMELLSSQFPGRYDAEAETIARRLDKMERRKREKPGVKTKKKSAGEE